MIRGVTKNINIGIGANKNSDPLEVILPQSIDRRNGKTTDAGNWKRRPGYTEKWNTGTSFPVELLIPEYGGFATAGNGKVFKIGDSPTEITGAILTGAFKPTYTSFQPTSSQKPFLVLCDGGAPIKVGLSPVTISLLGGSPVHARFVDTVDTRVVMCGHDDLTFVWSDLENAESYPAANFNYVLGDGDRIVFFKIEMRLLYFFKSHSIEIWSPTGSSPFFGRQHFIEKGCGAPYSPVFANNKWYWYGDDGEFYSMSGISPAFISLRYRAEIDKAEAKEEMYGFHFAKEKLIRWFAPTANKCFVFDYMTETFSEDNIWSEGDWLRLPIKSYMEMNGEQYIGDYNATGKIYHWSKDYKDDNGQPIRVFRKFAFPMADGHEARANLLRLRVERGNGTAAVPNPDALIRWRFDQGEYLSENYDLGQFGDHYPYIDIPSLGIGRELEFEMIESDAVDSLITHAWLTAEQLGA